MRREVIECRLPDGSTSLREIPTPAWVFPEAAGQTPMHQALDQAREIAEAWCRRPEHAESFPPTIFNITDGEATDCDEEELRAVCERIRALRTCDGNVLLINIHIAAGDSQQAVFFPSEEEAAYPNRYASLLYACSSPDAILDAPPGVSCPAVTVTRDVDLILLVADPTPFGFHDFRLAHQAFLPLNKAMAVVINRAGAEGNADGDAAVRDYCREHGLPLLTELPFERAAAEQYANGRLLAALSPEWKQRFEHLRDALRRLGGEVCHA